MNNFELYNKLKKIPFLKLGKVSYLDELKTALEELRHKETKPFVTSNELITVEFGLDVISIYDFEGDQTNGSVSTTLMKGKVDIWDVCKPTAIAQEFPILQRAVEDYLTEPSRCRLSKLSPGKQVLWHAHSYLHKNPKLTEIILHLPIQATNVKAQVKNRSRTELYETEFLEGEVWYLNTWLPHSFYNQGSIDRYHIWYNAYLTGKESQGINLKLQELFNQALINYTGPYIE
jgi:hypothetical protein